MKCLYGLIEFFPDGQTQALQFARQASAAALIENHSAARSRQ